MFRSIFTVVLSAGLLFSIAAAIDVSKTKESDVVLTNEDIAPKTQEKQLESGSKEASFIGDVEAGTRYPNELVFRRNLEVINPTGDIHYAKTFLKVPNAKVNYVKIVNGVGSQIVACVDESTLGTPKADISLRVPAETRGVLTVVVAAHEK